MNNDAVIKMVEEIAVRVKQGEKEGTIDCPYCGGKDKVQYIYGSATAMRAKCEECQFYLMA